MWRDVPHPRNPKRLLFRFDAERELIQIQDRGEKYTIDLNEIAPVRANPSPDQYRCTAADSTRQTR